jgi:hypothetical protein
MLNVSQMTYSTLNNSQMMHPDQAVFISLFTLQ